MGILLDIDGTLLDAGRPIDGAIGAVAALRDLGLPLLFATNTSRRSRAAIAASLRDAGLEAAESEILSAAWAAAVRLEEEGIRRVQLLLPPEVHVDFGAFEITDRDPQAVVVGDLGDRLDAPTLDAAFRSLRGGARLVATQKNRCWKSAEGWKLDAGAWVAALEYGAEAEAEVIGKPATGFFRMAARALARDPGELTMVGDDLEADVGGGRAAGLSTILVRTGKYDEGKLATATPERRPDRVIDSIRDLPATLG